MKLLTMPGIYNANASNAILFPDPFLITPQPAMPMVSYKRQNPTYNGAPSSRPHGYICTDDRNCFARSQPFAVEGVYHPPTEPCQEVSERCSTIYTMEWTTYDRRPSCWHYGNKCYGPSPGKHGNRNSPLPPSLTYQEAKGSFACARCHLPRRASSRTGRYFGERSCY